MIGLFREKVLRRLLRHHVYVMRDGLGRGLKRRGDPGLRALLGLVRAGAPLSREHRHFEALRLEGQVVYDIGGYEGVLAMFFARRTGPAGRVFTFEPNPVNAARIRDHLALNGISTVEVVELGLGAAAGVAELVFDTHLGATGSLDPSLQQILARSPHASSVTVQVDTLDSVVAVRGLPLPDFVKIDVEGLEVAVLEGMKETLSRARPALHVEIHGEDLARQVAIAGAVVERMLAAGYSPWHLESGTALTLDNAAVGHTGHILADRPPSSR